MSRGTRNALQVLGVLVLCSVAAPVAAHPTYAALIPCRTEEVDSSGTSQPCITCHNNADGGGGCATAPCLNPFGDAFGANGLSWNSTLSAGDADGDGFTNGQELGDLDGTWTLAGGIVLSCSCVARPGFADSTPGDTDGDSDGFCCVGRDTNGNGNCRDAGEIDATAFDCDDTMMAVNSGAMEICTNTIDNDCDGSATLVDSDCSSVVDVDGDGYCVMGRDTDGDGNCLGSGEMTTDSDCNDDPATSGASMTPGSRENCGDMLDNDCNTLVDDDDPMCRGDVDNDMDGFCPIGTDLSMPPDGDCLDPGEADAGFDCDDTNPLVNPNQPEICTDGADNNCDGFEDFLDSACAGFSDVDGDGYCPRGRDMDGDGSCIDAGEDVGPFDCEDDPAAGGAAINPDAVEICTETVVDEDCDSFVSLADSDCAGYIDEDGDRYCAVGFDMDRDGLCTSPGEDMGSGDCDETRDAVNPTATEICTDTLDNDCDGSADANDRPTCDEFRDSDGDGWCLIGQDMNGDGDCSDAMEQGGPTERPAGTLGARDPGSEGDPTTFPGAPENCFDSVDNDLDGMTDETGYCVRDRDADMDGYCPIGQDLNGDGDCLDDGENVAVTDCNESDATINPGAMERCLEVIDADCDGDIRTLDSDCFYLLDRDGDGICGMGTDDTGDGDCEDANEDRFGVDCDDTRTDVNSRLIEMCGDGVDNDCDGDIDVRDSQCECTDDMLCDDGDPCTTDTCGAGGRGCSNTPDPTCGEGGMPDSDGSMCVGDECGDSNGGCGCSVPGRQSQTPLLWLMGLGALLVFGRRWRRRG